MSVVNEAFADGVYTITLNRPEKKNPMNLELLQALFAALEGAEKQAAPIVVIRGAGKAFCAGGDIVEFKNAPNTEQMIYAATQPARSITSIMPELAGEVAHRLAHLLLGELVVPDPERRGGICARPPAPQHSLRHRR